MNGEMCAMTELTRVQGKVKSQRRVKCGTDACHWLAYTELSDQATDVNW